MTVKYSKTCNKTLRQQVDVVAQYHAHKIQPQRIAYRTGIQIELITQLLNGEAHQRLFKKQLAAHRKNRRDQRLQQSFKIKGIAQASLQDQIEQEYKNSQADDN